MSAVRYYRYDDAGAPSIEGKVGSLTNLLRKCLVGTGGTAYGSKPSAGWTEAYTGTNIAVFRNSVADGGSGCYVRVNDNAPAGGGGAREATINVYGNMTGINTGTSPLKTVYARKSATADAVARKWLIVADARTAWLYIWETGDGSYAGTAYDVSFNGFGDFASIHTTTARYFNMGRIDANNSFGGQLSAVISRNFSGPNGLSAMPLTGTGSAVDLVIDAPGLAGGCIGGYYWPSRAHSVTAKTYFMRNPNIFAIASSELHGSLRGLALPYQNLQSSPRAAGFEGEASLILCHVAADGASSDFASLLLDAVGPWS